MQAGYNRALESEMRVTVYSSPDPGPSRSARPRPGPGRLDSELPHSQCTLKLKIRLPHHHRLHQRPAHGEQIAFMPALGPRQRVLPTDYYSHHSRL